MSTTLKILFLSTISLMLLVAPLTFEVDLGNKAHAMSKSGGKSDGKRSLGPIARTYKTPDPEIAPEGSTPIGSPQAPVPNPEPATLLLFGAGAVGLAAFKKKFRKK